MSNAKLLLEAGGIVPAKTKVDEGATEQIVARTYQHPALGSRPVIRLTSARLGEAEDLAMEFLGFEAPQISKPIAIQQRRSLGFAAWALINDPDNARYALDLVKRMKAADRKAKSKPGHAWDAFADLSKELGRSVRHFLPPFWEEVGRTYKDLGNQTYAGRALNKSLEAERVHALDSDRARRRDVVLEFVLAGCLAGKALSDYANDLTAQYAADEAYSIFRDLCVRRTRGGMAPWATMPKDFTKLAKAAGLDGEVELSNWLEEVIEAPAMGRTSLQFWKTCSKHCTGIVARNAEFAMALLRHTRPNDRGYGESQLWPWLDLLEQWGVLEFVWQESHRGASVLGEPIAEWFGRIARESVPPTVRAFEMLEKLAPRLQTEKRPLSLSVQHRSYYPPIDVDLLEACFALGIIVDDPPQSLTISYNGWLSLELDHPFRNQDIVRSFADERFQGAILDSFATALMCRGGSSGRQHWRQSENEQRPFPLAAGERAGVKKVWHAHASGVVTQLEGTGLASFAEASESLQSTLWPDTLRLFPDLATRLDDIDPLAMLQRTLQAGVIDEYGFPTLEETVVKEKLNIQSGRKSETIFSFAFPDIAITDKVRTVIVQGSSGYRTHELRLPKKSDVYDVLVVGDDVAISYRDSQWNQFVIWASEPTTEHVGEYHHRGSLGRAATALEDGSVFFGAHAIRSGDKKLPKSHDYLHDGERFWRIDRQHDYSLGYATSSVREVSAETGKVLRESVPPWFEGADGGQIDFGLSELLTAPAGREHSPLGQKDGLIGWKALRRSDGSYMGEGIDGRRWDKPLSLPSGEHAPVLGLLKQPGTDQFLPITGDQRHANYSIWDPTGSTIVSTLTEGDYSAGQVVLLPLCFWHLMVPRHEGSSKKLRAINHKQCTTLLEAAAMDRAALTPTRGKRKEEEERNPLVNLLQALKKLLPQAPERMIQGIARIVELAEKESDAFAVYRKKIVHESRGESTESSLVRNQQLDSALAQWRLDDVRSYGMPDGISTSVHLSAAAAFLKGETEAGDLGFTRHVWFSAIQSLSLRCWQVYWKTAAMQLAEKEPPELSWLEFLKFWGELGIAALPGEFAILRGVPVGAKKAAYGGFAVDTNAGASFSLANGDDRFIAIEIMEYGNDALPYYFLRYSTSKSPGDPPGFEIKSRTKLKNDYDAEELKAFIDAVKSADGIPLPTSEELSDVATKLEASPAEIGLIWMAGLNMDDYSISFLPAALRKLLGWKAAEATAGRQSLQNLSSGLLDSLYASVVSLGPAAPFSADRTPVLQAIVKTWRAKMPKRLPLEASLQQRLAALGQASRWHHVSSEDTLQAAAEPAKHPLLQPRETGFRINPKVSYPGLQIEATTKKQPGVEESFVRSMLNLIAIVHGETPVGHSARPEMPRLIKQLGKLLDGTKLLLELRRVHIYPQGPKNQMTSIDWVHKHLGTSKGKSKDKAVQFDDGFIAAATHEHQALIGFRPAKLLGPTEMTRLRGIVATEADEEDRGDGTILSLIAVLKGAGFQALQKAIVGSDVPSGAWPQNPLHTAPGVVAEIGKKYKLAEEAAMLYAQLLALPDPTTSNVRLWNDWKPAQMKKAAAELIDKTLVLEAKRARAGRTLFLPGEWMELKTPWLPIESWKLPQLVDIQLDCELCPLGGPMVLRPFEDLFAAVWKRVLAGDPPRYEEANRKKK
jgi:hypothetical protein